MNPKWPNLSLIVVCKNLISTKAQIHRGEDLNISFSEQPVTGGFPSTDDIESRRDGNNL